MLNQTDKTQKQKELITLLSTYITSQLGDAKIAKQYLVTLGERDPQKALNKIGNTHSEIKKAIEALPMGSEEYKANEAEVVQAIEVVLKAYNSSKKDEDVAIGIVKSYGTKKPAQAAAPAPAPAQKGSAS